MLRASSTSTPPARWLTASPRCLLVRLVSANDRRLRIQHPPPYSELLWPALKAIRSLGHTATIEELEEAVIEQAAITEEQLAVLHGEGPRNEVEYRLAWARTYLKGMGLLDNPSRGTWVTTERGKTVTAEEVEPLRRDYLAALAEQRKLKAQAAEAAGADTDAAEETADVETEGWREQLLAALLQMDPPWKRWLCSPTSSRPSLLGSRSI